jgi:predicted Zn-dependent peptidase
MYKKERLNNGLKIITHSMPNMRSCGLGIWIKVGSRYEAKENNGIAHFFEHLVFKGTKKYSCHKLKETIEGVGGHLNGFTSEEITCYLVKIPSRYLELALDVLADMVINPLLPKPEIEKERTVILEEIKMYKDLPQSYVHELLDGLLWPNQPIGAPIVGTVDSVSKIQREHLHLFKDKYYNPPNIVVSAAGFLEHKRITRSIAEFFSPLKNKNIAAFSKAREKQNKPQLKIFPKDTEQTHMALGFHSFKREHPLKHALGLLHVILGANMSSRLFNEIREKKGLAYEIGTAVKRFHDTGAFIVHAGIDNHKVNSAIGLIIRELKKIRRQLISADEFKRAKEFYLGQLMLALEDTLDHMLWIGESIAVSDRTYSLKEIIKEIDKIKREDIRIAAQDIFREEKLNLALIGPLKGKEQKIYHQLHII